MILLNPLSAVSIHYSSHQMSPLLVFFHFFFLHFYAIPIRLLATFPSIEFNSIARRSRLGQWMIVTVDKSLILLPSNESISHFSVVFSVFHIYGTHLFWASFHSTEIPNRIQVVVSSHFSLQMNILPLFSIAIFFSLFEERVQLSPVSINLWNSPPPQMNLLPLFSMASSPTWRLIQVVVAINIGSHFMVRWAMNSRSLSVSHTLSLTTRSLVPQTQSKSRVVLHLGCTEVELWSGK